MTFLNPHWQDAKIYRWDDADAPQFSSSNAGSASTILKACLVTGYGSKQSAGWSMPFEDTTNGVKVFKPADSQYQEFYFRISDDNGSSAVVKMYFNMTDVNTGDLKLDCGGVLRMRAHAAVTNKWVIIATNRSCYMFTNASQNYPTLHGSFLFFGDTARNEVGNRALCLMHSGAPNSWYNDGLIYNGYDRNHSLNFKA